jgi:Icc-related predicted phosphoesterase
MKKSVIIILLSMVLVVFAMSAGMAAEMVVIQGQVTEDSQIQDQEGNVFDIADTEKGSELVENVGQKVEIEGTVLEDGGTKIITVETFRIIE